MVLVRVHWPAPCFVTVEMRAVTRWVLSLFLSPVGVVVLAALDSTLFFSLPLGIDTVIIMLSARMRDFAWGIALLASAGSVAGAALTFWMGKKIGEKGLDRYASKKRLDAIRKRVKDSGAFALAVLDLVPPPFPFTLFVLAAGALKVKPVTFFVTLGVCRVLRFGLEAWLAVVYGRRIIRWLDSDLFHDIVGFFIVLAIVLTAVSIYKLVRSTRPARKKRAAA
jgi:membrane protein YqaA with SNARE-associated domain